MRAPNHVAGGVLTGLVDLRQQARFVAPQVPLEHQVVAGVVAAEHGALELQRLEQPAHFLEQAGLVERLEGPFVATSSDGNIIRVNPCPFVVTIAENARRRAIRQGSFLDWRAIC